MALNNSQVETGKGLKCNLLNSPIDTLISACPLGLLVATVAHAKDGDNYCEIWQETIMI